uniref:Uncharacterized protein n=1 Tax=Cucumis sativus TaxID=3659 RepID=A0A0A0L684_CUCSA
MFVGCISWLGIILGTQSIRVHVDTEVHEQKRKHFRNPVNSNEDRLMVMVMVMRKDSDKLPDEFFSSSYSR